ncbi:MAG: S-layer homology domain-containing protein [Erysipelotrichaceae bacterium]|nr:S-layer homology domain-containing protein [Erysipelotrichaceae bacterium]
MPQKPATSKRETLTGEAYAIFTVVEGHEYHWPEDGDGELIFFRSTEEYEDGEYYENVKINGDYYEGTVYAGFEDLDPWDEEAEQYHLPSWTEDIYYYCEFVSVAEGHTIQPISMAAWFAFFYYMFEFDGTGFDTSECYDMYGTFMDCEHLESPNLKTWNTESVMEMSMMFGADDYGCESLYDLDLSSFDTSNVKNMYAMFVYAYVPFLHIGSFDTTAVTDMEYMFYYTSVYFIDLGKDWGNNWCSEAFLPEGDWYLLDDPNYLVKTEEELYDEFYEHGADWAGTWTVYPFYIASDEVIEKEDYFTEGLPYVVVGETQQFELSDDFYDNVVEWYTVDYMTGEDGSKLATVNNSGLVKGVKAGFVKLYAESTAFEYEDYITVLVEFTDVANENKYFFDPVYWALFNGITTGTSGSKFSPNDNCTRGQVVTFLWRAMGCPEPTIENPFEDVTEDKFFYKAVLWAYENGITTGTSATKFSPNAKCKREQIVTFLYRTAIYDNDGAAPSYTPVEMNFPDVKESNYFYDAVLWAYSTGITTGVNNNTEFGTGQNCVRGMVVTFLYRYSD